MAETEDPIQRRVQKVLETRYENNKETLEVLQDLSTYFGENTLANRRNFRNCVEKRSLAINDEFLGAFTDIKNVVDEVCGNIAEMSTAVKEMKTRLKNTEEQTQELISKTNQLQGKNEILQKQHTIASAFIEHFQLSPEEVKKLDKNSPIDEEFFGIIKKIQEIHKECNFLVKSGTETTAFLDIMEEMNGFQELALEKLYRWTQNHCRNLDSNNETIDPLIMKAMQQLQDRPGLFKCTIDEYAANRRTILVRNFIDVLNKGPKPIEMQANDPKKYINDMMAFLHSSLLVEKENLLLLVKNCDQLDTSNLLQSALVSISDGIPHPLKMRVQNILNCKDTIVLYSICNLIKFYQNIIHGLIKGGNGKLETCLEELRQLSETAYISSITLKVKSHLQQFNEHQINDLNPPPSLYSLLSLLKEILSVVANMVDERQSDITKVVQCIVDPLLQQINVTASQLTTTTDMAVFILNCIYEIQTTLAIFEYMDQRLELLEASSEAQLDTLTSEQANSLVANLNLTQLYTVLKSGSKFDAHLLKLFLKKFDEFLEMPDILFLPQTNLLIASSHREAVQKRSFNVIHAIYKQLYERVMDPESGFDANLFQKTPDMVLEMLGLNEK
ncbi:conserved oligomeric Golgi complex subunit 6 [Culicoides brevitarsis]|uniref:conserved oligomeric Golgi complex subunit 6 n=1 Tax=Culicoides brevitarsis TaxID=469753 RepID=UPI00307C2B3E